MNWPEGSSTPGPRAPPRGAMLISVEGFDWNCPQHSPVRIAEPEDAQDLYAVTDEGALRAAVGPVEQRMKSSTLPPLKSAAAPRIGVDGRLQRLREDWRHHKTAEAKALFEEMPDTTRPEHITPFESGRLADLAAPIAKAWRRGGIKSRIAASSFSRSLATSLWPRPVTAEALLDLAMTREDRARRSSNGGGWPPDMSTMDKSLPELKSWPVVPREQANRDVDDALARDLAGCAEPAAFGGIDALEKADIRIGRPAATSLPHRAHALNRPLLRCWSLARCAYLVFDDEERDLSDLRRTLHGQRDVPAWMQKPSTDRSRHGTSLADNGASRRPNRRGSQLLATESRCRMQLAARRPPRRPVPLMAQSTRTSAG